MASLGKIEVAVVHVDGGHYQATECGRCAALIREDRKDKHADVCGQVPKLTWKTGDLRLAIEADAKRHGSRRGHI